MAEKFALKWNDFNSNASKAFGLFRNEEFLHDVTLVAEDNTQIKANKLVLSSCSEYFKNIFRNNNHSHPLLCLQGLTSEDIRRVLDYIYDGEVKIFQENLDKFLAIVQKLKLQGLLGDPPAKEPEESAPNVTPFKHKKTSTNQEPTESFEMPNTSQSKPISTEVATTKYEAQPLPLSEDDRNNLNEQINQLLERIDDGRFQCSLCEKVFKTKQQCQNHIEARHIEGISIPCHLCGKAFRSRNRLATHKTKEHVKAKLKVTEQQVLNQYIKNCLKVEVADEK